MCLEAYVKVKMIADFQRHLPSLLYTHTGITGAGARMRFVCLFCLAGVWRTVVCSNVDSWIIDGSRITWAISLSTSQQRSQPITPPIVLWLAHLYCNYMQFKTGSHTLDYYAFTRMRLRSDRHTVTQRQNKRAINTDLSVTSIHTHMQSSPCQGRLLGNQYLPVMSLSGRGDWTHTHISIKQAYTISPSILISTWLKCFTVVWGGGGRQCLITCTL